MILCLLWNQERFGQYELRGDQTGAIFAKIDEVKSELEVKQEFDLLFHLQETRFPFVQPLKTKMGRYYVEFRGKCLTVSRLLDGIELSIESLTGTHLGVLGHTLANLH